MNAQDRNQFSGRISAAVLVSTLLAFSDVADAAGLVPGDIVIATQIGPTANNDFGLVLVDPATGNRTVLSDNNTGTGPGFAMPEGIALEPDGGLLVTDIHGPGGYARLFRVDPTTGDRTVISANGVGSGPLTNALYGVVEVAGTIYASSGSGLSANVLQIDPVTGDRSRFVIPTPPLGPLFEPIGLAVQGNSLLVADYGFLFSKVDLSTGQAATVAYTGTTPQNGVDVTVSRSGTVLVSGQSTSGDADQPQGVFSVNLLTHVFSPVSDASVGTGPMMGSLGPAGIGTEWNGAILLNEDSLNAILSINPNTGDRTIFSDATHGTGPTFTDPQGLLVVPQVPEPSTILLAALGVISLLACRWRSTRRVLQAATLVVVILVSTNAARAVTMDWSPVGNPGNAPDPATGSSFGAVPYTYKIGTNDVTNDQYAEFLNAKDPTGADPLGLWYPLMEIGYSVGNANGNKYSAISGDGSHPVNFVSWYGAARFANWLNNGQGNGDTETGAYTLLGGTPTPSNGLSIVRNAGATVFLPSQNEWYKAAFYNPATSSYYLYATSSNTPPTATTPTATPNSANYNGAVGHLTDVGAYTGTTSPYGAYDMAGNVYQWNEALIQNLVRGLSGSFAGSTLTGLLSSTRGENDPRGVNGPVGFRVASIPEPSTIVLAALGVVALMAYRWRIA